MFWCHNHWYAGLLLAVFLKIISNVLGIQSVLARLQGNTLLILLSLRSIFWKVHKYKIILLILIFYLNLVLIIDTKILHKNLLYWHVIGHGTITTEPQCIYQTVFTAATLEKYGNKESQITVKFK